MLGLPTDVRACLFDLDGVLTQTAKVHAAAWKAMFDEYLRQRAEERGEEFTEFDAHHDYDQYVDGKPCYEGVRSFLEARNIELPEGAPTDPPEAETIDGLGNRKNDLVQELLAAAAALGVAPGEAALFEDALAGVEAGRAGNCAVVVGVDRVGRRDALGAHGADIVVDDLAELLESR
jgi:beta-phosphoglucomutase-like phosphatase (HAD superfamily)